MTARAGFYIAVHGVIGNGGQILLGCRANTSYGDGLYAFPAGHLERGETLQEALVRELNEETRIAPAGCFNLMAAPALLIEHMKDCGPGVPPETRFRHYQDFFFRVDGWQGEPVNGEPDRCSHLAFFNRQALPENILPLDAHALDCMANKQGYARFGWDHPDYPAWKAAFG